MLFKIMFATFDSTVQSRVFICFSCLRKNCSRCLMLSIFYTSKRMTPKKKTIFKIRGNIVILHRRRFFNIFFNYSGSATQIVPLVSGSFNWRFLCPRYGYLDSLWGFPYLHVAIHLLEQARGRLPCFRR